MDDHPIPAFEEEVNFLKNDGLVQSRENVSNRIE